ncbi:MAG: FAD-dependent oxidoreductase [Kiritimatiellae bacterium]|nr:FAD-dependent oxidoreductase [Kiritimatiellia bacterium]
MKERHEAYDVAVIGGGMAGICAAVAAARCGARTVLIQDRPVLGGNASGEIRVHINGAQGLRGAHGLERETGILEEILLENRMRNPQESYSVWDHLLYEFVRREPNLVLHLNTTACAAEMDAGSIRAARCHQLTTETALVIGAKLFVDCSGDGLLAASAGAEFRMGREGRAEFDESFAPEQPDSWTMGASLTFISRDMGYPVPYEPPFFARPFDPAHSPKGRQLGGEGLRHGHWWIEVGSETDVIGDQEQIRDKLMGYLHGVWDHIKNSGRYPEAANLVLNWVGSVPGKRESRRFVGDYLLNQNDLLGYREFEDAVAFGGWPIDEHCPGGIESLGEPPAYFHHHFDKPYQIPFRCLYSKSVSNLLFAGRNASFTHIALSSARVMATCAVMGQAAGTAAALCAQSGRTPRELGAAGRVGELQERLLRDDAYIPHRPARDAADLARGAQLAASSTTSGAAALLTDGVARDEDGGCHHWESDGLPADVCLSWAEPQRIGCVEVKLDTNVHRPIQMSRHQSLRKQMAPGAPAELVRSLRVEAWLNGGWRGVGEADSIRTRRVRCAFPAVETDRVRIRFERAYGHPNARVFEVRAYAEGA